MSIPPPLRKLQYVLAVARELHFRRAAERLNVSQPYISRQIKEFEADIGFNIFRRDPVCLTASGQELVVRISEMLSRLDADFRMAVDAAKAVNDLIRHHQDVIATANRLDLLPICPGRHEHDTGAKP